MSFDRLAHVYRFLETALFGRALWRTRVCYLADLQSAKTVLLLGDGDGRFLAELRTRYPGIAVTTLDISTEMLTTARSRAARISSGAPLLFLCADVRQLPLPAHALGSFDYLVTHFLLDCLTQREMDEFAQTVGSSAKANLRWLVSEFAVPGNVPWRWLGGLLIRFLYWGSFLTTGLDITHLPDYGASLGKAGFKLERFETRLKGLLRSEIWVRSLPE